MATSKTLTPTGVTISIPEFTDQPDQRVNSNCIDKEADAINRLDTNMAGVTFLTKTVAGNGSVDISIANSKRCVVFVNGTQTSTQGMCIAGATSGGVIRKTELNSMTGITFTTDTNTLTVTNGTSYSAYLIIMTETGEIS